jgi:hypothetical protein
MGFFMAGLWLLVIVSGPAFDEAGPRAGAGYPWAGVDNLSEDGPGPISGDGHFLTHANWTLHSCHNNKSHNREVVCTSSTQIELDIPLDFKTTDGIFFFADPPRTNHLTDGRGHVPGTITIEVMDEGGATGVQKGKAQVIVTAEYEQRRKEVFEHVTVGKMAAGLTSQGVGIYSYPLPRKYARRRPPPLVMHTRILLPSGAIVPALKVQASAMSIGAFAQPLADKQKRAPIAVTNVQPPQFGRLILQTATSPILIGRNVSVSSVGTVKATTYNGDIVLEGTIHSPEVRLETMTGNVRIAADTEVIAWRESKVSSQTGNIDIAERSTFFSGEMVVKTSNGNILGGGKGGSSDHGVWKTNKTLDMQTFNGAVHASFKLVRSTDAFANPTNLVRVEVESKNGAVDTVFDDQESGTPLQAKVLTGVGAASARMAPSFVGTWELEGSRGASSVQQPKANDPRPFIDRGIQGDLIKIRQQGSIGGEQDETKKQSSVMVQSSLGGAQLIF